MHEVGDPGGSRRAAEGDSGSVIILFSAAPTCSFRHENVSARVSLAQFVRSSSLIGRKSLRQHGKCLLRAGRLGKMMSRGFSLWRATKFRGFSRCARPQSAPCEKRRNKNNLVGQHWSTQPRNCSESRCCAPRVIFWDLCVDYPSCNERGILASRRANRFFVSLHSGILGRDRKVLRTADINSNFQHLFFDKRQCHLTFYRPYSSFS